MKKTAEFEAQQARERAASDAKLVGDQDPDSATDSELNDAISSTQHHQLRSLPAAGFDTGDDTSESDYAAVKVEFAGQAASISQSPASSDSEGFVHVEYESSAAASARSTPAMAELAPPPTMAASFGDARPQIEFPQPTAFPFRLMDHHPATDGLPRPGFDELNAADSVGLDVAGAFGSFNDQDYFATPSVSRFPSEMVASSAPTPIGSHLLSHQASVESLATSAAVSPVSMPGSPSTMSNLRFKSPPPPADIAGRRKSRRPAPLGLSALRGAPGPKTGIEVPRRADTVSPMRRISSATGLYARVQKSFAGSGGPRSPFAMDRNKEALLQSLQETQALGSDSMLGPGVGECASGPNSSEDEQQSYPFGSLGAVSGAPLYGAAESALRSPPGTPGLSMGFHEAYFPTSIDHTWNYVQQDEPLPTPSLCSHGGSELEFSMAPPLPGYVASQPVTPSFPPAMGPTYTGFFGTSVGQTEYHFPESYPAESSARSSPVAPPRSKQFQFAQNITPQDFNSDKP